jgi:hypothetical protein
MTWHKAPRLKIAPVGVRRLQDNIREKPKGARGRNIANIIQELKHMLRGLAVYFIWRDWMDGCFGVSYNAYNSGSRNVLIPVPGI